MSVRDSDVIQAIKDKLLAECEMRTGTQEAPGTLLGAVASGHSG